MEKREKPYAVIYAIANTVTERGYIGQTTKPEHRIYSHMKKLADGSHPNAEMQKDYNAHGLTAFSFFILDEISEEMAFESGAIEGQYIKMLRNGYNVTENKNRILTNCKRLKLNIGINIFLTELHKVA